MNLKLLRYLLENITDTEATRTRTRQCCHNLALLIHVHRLTALYFVFSAESKQFGWRPTADAPQQGQDVLRHRPGAPH